MWTLLLVLGMFVSEGHCGYFFVTAPNVLRYNQEETVVVSVFGLTNAAVKWLSKVLYVATSSVGNLILCETKGQARYQFSNAVWLELEDKRFSERTVTVTNEKTPFHTFVKVTEDDILATSGEEKARRVILCAEWNGVKYTREILLSYHTGYLITQTDKPIYTPMEKVQIRTLALDESLKAVDGWQVGIDIISPSNAILGRKLIEKSVTGFYENNFILPPKPETGIWSARAFYKGQFETESHAHFEVQESVLPTFGVTVDVDVEYILPQTSDITITVKAKYVYGKPVKGNARLTLNLKGKDEDSDYILNVGKKKLEIYNDIEGSATEFSINVQDILNSPLLRDEPSYPNDKRLEVIATVYESATGKEEAASHEGTIFTTNPFIFKFTKSKLNFRPGYQYNLKVEVLYVNGKPAEDENMHVEIYEDGVLKKEIAETTNTEGRIIYICSTSRGKRKLSFKASTADNAFESDEFEVIAYEGKNQIQVESVITERNTTLMQAYTNINGNTYTGMLFVVMTRGKIVYTRYHEPSNEASEEVTEQLQEIISPDARLLVFYVDKSTGELMADSIKFEVEKKCRGRGLHLKTQRKEVRSGYIGHLTVTGTPFMYVGLNIIDKALLLRNDKNVLKKEKMFETLQSHDLGCGEGSGRSGADNFKKSGLTILTNAQVDQADLERENDGCKRNIRKRRDSLEDESEYLEDIAKLANIGIIIRTRTDFRESWLFSVHHLDNEGQTQIHLNAPDSITEWRIQAIGITENIGMCIADPVDFKAFRNVYILLDLPYKATRLEHFNVKATIFNYGMPNDDNKTVNVYLEGVDGICYNSDPGKPSPRIQVQLPPNSAKTVSFPMIPLKNGLFPVKVSAIDTHPGIPEVDVIEKKLLVVNEGIEEKLNIIVCLDPLKQNKACVNDERVDSDIQSVDNMRFYQIDLTLPENSISQTGAATAYIQRVSRMILQYRHDDGAYSAWKNRTASTWLTAFVAKVFCQAKKIVDDTVDKEDDIKITIDWLNAHVNDDGSFNDYLPVIHREMIGQTREKNPTLTAFVLITLQECGIKSVNLNTAIRKSVRYLENLPEKTLRSNPYLLAISTYALAMSDSPKKYTFKKLLIDTKIKNKEGSYWGNPGGKLANANSVETTAYALLAMLKFNDLKNSFSIVSWLISQKYGQGSFRTTQDTAVGLQALSQYSIATYSADVDLEVGFFADGWVGTERRVNKENALVQQVIPRLPVERGNNRLLVRVQGTGSAVMTIDLRYNRPAAEEESCPFRVTEIDVRDVGDTHIDKELAIVRNCDICGYCEWGDDFKYNDNESDNFGDDLSDIDPKVESNFERRVTRASGRRAIATRKCIWFSVSSKNGNIYGMSIVKFGLETGVNVIKSDLDKLVAGKDTNIARYEMPSDGKGFIVFYLHKISPGSDTKFIFRLIDSFDGDIFSRQSSSVDVYDYYNPDKHCTQFYSIGPHKGKTVYYQCTEDRKECKCLQSMCVRPVTEEIKALAKRKKKPALKLYKYACNADKANYAVIVKIDEVSYNIEKQEKTARGVVETSINQGIEKLTKGDGMAFFWKFYCIYPHLEEGKSYCIIGRDITCFKKRDEEIFRYTLMGSALVIESETSRQAMKNKNRNLHRTMTNFKRLMQTYGCLN